MTERIAELMKHDVAGDPMGGLRWTRRTTEGIARELYRVGIEVGSTTVGRLLHAMGFSLHVNHKKLTKCAPETRDEQFHYIEHLRGRFSRKGRPILSVDTKKRELVGRFKNPGRTWQRQPIPVNAYDFRSDAKGVAIPYGIYDVEANRGSIFIGVSHDTPAFAVASLTKWWRYDGVHQYPSSRELLVLADGGGSNGPRNRAWKLGLQRLCDRVDVRVTVCHYPSGASKWNPVEHRLFSEISRDWAGQPLDSYETILNYIRSTETRAGLRVKAYLDPTPYPTQVRVPEAVFAAIRCREHPTLPEWNYTITPKNW